VSIQDWSSNAMGLKGIVAIERLLIERRASLQHLYFNNCGNEADAVEHIHKCLLPTEVGAPLPCFFFLIWFCSLE
jgi:hypothetical protein